MVNNVVIQGRLTRNVEVRAFQSGSQVGTFSVACDRDYKSKDSNERGVDFINCQAWGNTAGFISKYFSKGDMIVVTGRLEVSQYKDRDGNNRYDTHVNVSTANFCGGRNNSQGQAQTNAQSNYPQGQQTGQSAYQPQTQNQQSQNPYEFMDIPEGVEDGGLPFN